MRKENKNYMHLCQNLSTWFNLTSQWKNSIMRLFFRILIFQLPFFLLFSSHFFTPQVIVIVIFFGCYIKIAWNVFYGVVQQGDLNFTSSKKKVRESNFFLCSANWTREKDKYWREVQKINLFDSLLKLEHF